MAERLWSDPIDTGWKEAEHRILEQRRRMAIFRNIHADAVQPEFCRQNDGFCYPVSNTISSFGMNPQPFHQNSADGVNELPPHLRNPENKDFYGRLTKSNGKFIKKLQVRPVTDVNGLIKWFVFVIVLLIIIMVKRRLVCTVILKIVQYCRNIADAADPRGTGIRMLSIR